MNQSYYSLYCKQRELQQAGEAHWACGFACLVTCFRILGDRTTENQELVGRFRSFGGITHEGMSTDEAVNLAQAFGYGVVRNPKTTRRQKDAFFQWMRRQWAEYRPVMLSVDSANLQREADHWWTVFGAPEQEHVWVMEPLQDNLPFQVLSLSDVGAYASCDDGNGVIEYDAVAVLPSSETSATGIPPSTELMNFINAQCTHATGWTSHAIAAAVVDNHFSSLENAGSSGRDRVRGAIGVCDLLEVNGRVHEILNDWAVFFTKEQEQNMANLIRVLYDIEAHQQHFVAKDRAERIAHEIAINLMLIATRLMDG